MSADVGRLRRAGGTAAGVLLLLEVAACGSASQMPLGDAIEALDTALGGGADLTQDDIAAGLREALQVGTTRTVDALGREDAFLANPAIHIPLPGPIADAQHALRPLGMSGLLDDLELRLNRGAERAMPVAGEIFWDAIASLTFDDVIEIWQGPDDAATRYLERTAGPALTTAMRPVVADTLADAGALKLYDSVLEQTRAVPMLPDLRADLTGHVLVLSMEALFARLAREERAIRENPAERTTPLLQRVFGALT